MKCAAVIAAAGRSSRTHELKPMLCLGESTMIESIVQSLRAAGVDEIVAVTGYKSEILQRHLASFNVHTVENPEFADTKMFDSLKLGLQALTEPYDAVLLTPGDVPLVQPDTIRALMRTTAGIARPVCGGRGGHPILLSAEVIPEILRYTGEGGLRGVLRTMRDVTEYIEVSDIGITMDADTPADLKALRQRKMETRSGGKLWPDVQIQIAKGDIILTPETAQYLEMIDHTGSIQSACACMHMSYSRGWKLLNQMETALGYPLVERFPGGVSGGGSSLTAKGRMLLRTYQDYRSALQSAAEQLFAEMFPEALRM